MPGANQGHIYYQLHILPIGAILGAIGFSFCIKRINYRFKKSNHHIRKFTVFTSCLLLIVIHVYGYKLFFDYMYDTSIRMPHTLEVSDFINKEIPHEGFIVINQPKSSTLPLTYYSQRASWDWRWNLSLDELDEIEKLELLRKRGAHTFVAVDTSYSKVVHKLASPESELGLYLQQNYKLLKKTPNYIIYSIN
jgi:hypothetical protein